MGLVFFLHNLGQAPADAFEQLGFRNTDEVFWPCWIVQSPEETFPTIWICEELAVPQAHGGSNGDKMQRHIERIPSLIWKIVMWVSVV